VETPPNLRALTFIVLVVPPPPIARAFANLGTSRQDLRPVMEAHNEGGFGSGFVVVARAPQRAPAYVVTNQHVVGLATRVTLAREGSKARVEARVLHVDPVYDLAILELTDAAMAEFNLIRGLGFAKAPPRDQDVVVASGFPGIQGEPSYQVTRGYVSNQRVLLDVGGQELPHIQHTAPIDPGSSGGPLLDEKGQVLGINTLKVSWREGVGLAVPAKAIEAALSYVEQPRDQSARERAQELCQLFLDNAVSGAHAYRMDRFLGAELVAKEGARSLWLLPDDDTNWLAEFLVDPARVMALAVGFRLRRELEGLRGSSCNPQANEKELTFILEAPGPERRLVFDEEQGSLKLVGFTFSPSTGRSFLDPKKSSGRAWKPSL